MSILSQLKSAFPQFNFIPNHFLAPQTYFKIGGKAEVYLELSERQEIINLITFCKTQQLKLTILGGASNVVINDKGISGLVLRLKNNQFTNLNQVVTENKYLLRAEAGIKTSLLVKQVTALGYTGLEYFLGVPGTLGGAIYNNAHYLEHLIGKHVWRVEVINQANQVIWLNQAECEFSYDHSHFQKTQEIILQVEFALKKGSLEKSQKLIQQATAHRANTQPLGQHSTGCIFKNPPNTSSLKKLFPQFATKEYISAGFLIDQAGLKGVRVGDVTISQKHAAFFINQGKGRAADLRKLVKLVQQAIKQKFKLDLKEEIFYLS